VQRYVVAANNNIGRLWKTFLLYCTVSSSRDILIFPQQYVQHCLPGCDFAFFGTFYDFLWDSSDPKFVDLGYESGTLLRDVLQILPDCYFLPYETVAVLFRIIHVPSNILSRQLPIRYGSGYSSNGICGSVLRYKQIQSQNICVHAFTEGSLSNWRHIEQKDEMICDLQGNAFHWRLCFGFFLQKLRKSKKKRQSNSCVGDSNSELHIEGRVLYAKPVLRMKNIQWKQNNVKHFRPDGNSCIRLQD
jgi:hypothetical protein